MAITGGRDPTIDANTALGFGLFGGYTVFTISGFNPDVDTGSLPEDIWNGGGVYTGFPTGAPETVEVFSSSASDTGPVLIRGLQSSTSTAYSTETIQLTGTTPVASVQAYYRVNQGAFLGGAPTSFNVGTITCRHTVTTANVFFVMPIGRSITAVAAFTVPSGNSALVTGTRTSIVSGGANDSIEATLWIRNASLGPLLPTALSATPSSPAIYSPRVGFLLSAGADMIMRVVDTQASNVTVASVYEVILRRLSL
jgi:hypothetical protein